MSETNQSIVLDPSETARALELQALLNKDGQMHRRPMFYEAVISEYPPAS